MASTEATASSSGDSAPSRDTARGARSARSHDPTPIDIPAYELPVFKPSGHLRSSANRGRT